MIYKSKVRISGLTEETARGLIVCREVFQEHGLEAVVTSAKDSPRAHKATSYHKHGRAFDLRLASRLIYSQMLRAIWPQRIFKLDMLIAAELRERLGPDFQVILERHQTNPWYWHIHIEYDPK